MNYNSFIELQDKLHTNICRYLIVNVRKRTLVAIGTHDLDTIQGPFSYEARVPDDLKFIPLNQTTEMTGTQLMEFYKADRKLNKFLGIISHAPRFPIIYDANRQVLSLPPIINSNHSKIKMSTKNVLIECTATDLNKANIVLNTIVTMFGQYCSQKFKVEPMEITYSDGSKVITPDLKMRKVTANVDYINNTIGIKASPLELCSLVGKMSCSAVLSEDSKNLIVTVPPTRSDVLQECDVMEDAAIAYNFNKIIETTPKLNTIALQMPINKLADMIRQEIAFAGYTEALAFTLVPFT